MSDAENQNIEEENQAVKAVLEHYKKIKEILVGPEPVWPLPQVDDQAAATEPKLKDLNDNKA